MSARLIALGEGPDLTLEKPILLVGRHPECDIQLNSRKISRKHCLIGRVGDALIVRDLGSTNGVRINGHRTEEGKAVDGDELLIGNFRYRVSLKAEVSSNGKAPPPPKAPVRPVVKLASIDPTLDEAEEPVPLDEQALSRILTARPVAQAPKPAPKPKPKAKPPLDYTSIPDEGNPSSAAFRSLPPPDSKS